MRNLVLIGMPGSGKSEVGRRIAGRLGWSFLDTDEMIVRRAGREVSEIFAQDGEAAFRDLERAVVAQAARSRRVVIATGGGAPMDDRNMAALRRNGVIVFLETGPEVLLGRVGSGNGRPLLGADPAARVTALLAERRGRYAQADVILDASLSPGDLAEAALEGFARYERETVTVDVGEAAYPVHVGTGILDLAGWEVRRRAADATRAAVVTHARLWSRFGERVARSLEGAGLHAVIVRVPEGERSKSLARASAVIDQVAGAGLDRGDVVVGLGGGVIGDLAGFVAGIYMRGVALVHIPTTLLAQVDSAIGGKAAVNHPRAKNLAGVFHQPVLVLADVEVLRRLPAREVASGLAEVIKYGMACDAEVLRFVEQHLDGMLARDVPLLAECVRRCAAVKAGVVAKDPRERGPRRLLNYGHTVGHAVERMTPGVSHGQAVAIGMSVEAHLAVRLGMIPEDVVVRQEAILARAGLPVRLPAAAPPAAVLLEAMRLDKKVVRGALRFTLLNAAGRGVVDVPAPEPLVIEVIEGCRASS